MAIFRPPSSFGTSNKDTFYGDNTGNFFYAGDDIDALYGRGGIDWLFGDNGNDYIFGGSGNDYLYGDSAHNTSATGNDTIAGGRGKDNIFGQNGNDVLYGDSYLFSNQNWGGSDKIYGGKGNDIAYGGGGNDTLEGGDGNDTLIGGSATTADALTGGAGADTFVLNNINGFSVINDFYWGEGDKIHVDADVFGITSLGQLTYEKYNATDGYLKVISSSTIDESLRSNAIAIVSSEFSFIPNLDVELI